MTRRWICFKNATYLIGYSYILWWIFWHNMGVSMELLYWDRLLALIAFECAAIVYPIWVLGVIAITTEWRQELNNDQQKEDRLPGSRD